MTDGEVLALVTGAGVTIGNFVITSLDVTRETVNADGATESATVNLKLLENAYDKGTVDGKPADRPKYVTYSGQPAVNKPIVKTPKPPKPTAAKSVTKDISKAKAALKKAQSAYKKFQQGVKTANRAVNEIKRAVTAARAAYNSAKTKAATARKIYQRAKQLPTSLDGAISYADYLTSTASATADMTVIGKNLNNVTTAANKVDRAAAPVAAMSASKEVE
jgi:hypothetical protein